MPKCRSRKCGRDLADDWIYCPWCGIKQKHTKRKVVRRENGTGSVYKRSDLKNRPWIAATPAKKNHKPDIIGHYETAQQAKDALDAFRINPTDRLNITLKELYEEWLPIGLKGKSDELKRSYSAAWKRLYPLYSEKFRELRSGHFQSIIDSLQEEHPKLDDNWEPIVKDGKPVLMPPLNYSTLHNIKTLVKLLYRYAMQNDIANKNYAAFIVLPPKPKGVKECFNELERKKIENAAFGINGAEKIPFADCILFMNYTGLRITEFCILNKFSIHKQGNICALYGGIKTEAGKNKIIPIHHKVLPILDDWVSKNGQTIFCQPDGKPFTANYFRIKCYYPALERIGVRRLPPHATRRTCATMMSQAHVQEEDFIAIMGHSDFKMDIESYIYETAQKLKPSIEKMP